MVCLGTTIWEDAGVSKKDLGLYWGADPVHLAPHGYEKLAEKLVDKLEKDQTKKRGRADSDAERPKLDTADRKAGISKSDTVAHRWEGTSGQGGRLYTSKNTGQNRPDPKKF